MTLEELKEFSDNLKATGRYRNIKITVRFSNDHWTVAMWLYRSKRNHTRIYSTHPTKVQVALDDLHNKVLTFDYGEVVGEQAYDTRWRETYYA